MDIWWEIFSATGNPYAYVNSKDGLREDADGSHKDDGDSDDVKIGGGLQ